MALTQWTHVTSEGEIADLPARGFQYRYAIQADINFSGDIGAGISIILAAMGGVALPLTGLWAGQIQGTWRLRVVAPGTSGGDSGEDDAWAEAGDLFGIDLGDYGVDTGAADGTTIFEQTVTLTFQVAALVTALVGIPVLSVFTWYLGREQIETTVCGRPLAPGEAPDTIGAEQGVADPASGNDYTDVIGSISLDWLSPIYRLAVPRGARVVVDFHNIGLADAGTSLLPISTRVVRANTAAVRDPRQGVSWVLISSTTGLQVGSVMDTGQPGPFAGRVADGGGLATIFRPPHSTTLLVLTEGMGELALYRSLAEGQEGTWHKVASLTGAMELVVACLSQDGSTIHVLGLTADNSLHAYQAFIQGDGDLALVDLGAVIGISGVEAGAVMEDRGGKLHLIITGVADYSYHYSRDSGITWH